MFRFIRLLTTIAIIFFPCLSKAQINIGGIVNSYAKINSISGVNLTLSNTSGFGVGDKVMIIQMTGALSDSTNSSAFGSIIDYRDCGNYELNNIQSISGNTIILNNNLQRTYTTSYAVQLVKIPVYTSANVTTTLKAPAWNGQTGGIIAIEVLCELIISDSIIASGLGFRGGIAGPVSPSQSCPNCQNAPGEFMNLTSGLTGEKGEGIFYLNASKSAGTGPATNGGGGGNCKNGGGGGGSNGGIGGIGGYSFNVCPGASSTVSGKGGLSLAYNNPINKIFMGGGGGGGNQDDQPGVGSSGAPGGGIIYIKAKKIRTNTTQYIRSDGWSAALAQSDGAGGGGAGGTILIDCINYSSSLNITAKGGNGGNNNSHGNNGYCHAPGGGGGGGIIWLASSTLNSGISYNLSGGGRGMITNSTAACVGTSYGADSGRVGKALYNLSIIDPQSASLNSNLVKLGNDTAICPTQSLNLNAGNGFSAYLWDNNSTGKIRSVNAPGKYFVTVTDTNFCTSSDTINVDIIPPIINISDTVKCSISSVTLDAGNNFIYYKWHDNSTNRFFNVSTETIVWVEKFNSLGCKTIDTFYIKTLSQPQKLSIGSDSILCSGDSMLISSNNTYNSYHWNTGSSSSSILIKYSGTYILLVDSLNCNPQRDTLVATFVAPIPPLLPDTSTCQNDSIIVDAGSGYKNYLWMNGATSQSIKVANQNIIWVKTTDQNGCASYDSALITVHPLPTVNLRDTVRCGFVPLQFDAGAGFTSYLWHDNSSSRYFTSISDSLVKVRVTSTYNCIGSDSSKVLIKLPIKINAGPDTILCQFSEFQLFVPGNFNNIKWADSNSSNPRIFYDTGTYIVTGLDQNGCTSSDTFTILINSIGATKLFIPNTFTPNFDEFNPKFPSEKLNVNNFYMIIFNRWGEKIFESSSGDLMWDGTYFGQACPEGVYFFILTYVDCSYKHENIQGVIHLIR